MNDLFPRLKTQLQNFQLKETSLFVTLAVVSALLGFVVCYFLVPIKKLHLPEKNNNAELIQQLVSKLVERDAKKVATAADGISIGYFNDQKVFIPAFEQEAEKGRYSASLIKIPTILTVLGSTPFDTLVTIGTEGETVEGGGFKPGSVVSVRDLAAAMMVNSSNDAVETFKKYYSEHNSNLLEQVKIVVASLETPSVIVGSLSGLDNENVKSFVSARDAIKLARIVADNYPWLAYLSTLPSYTSEKTGEALPNTNPLVSSIPGLIFSKTGFTTDAGGNLVILFNSCDRLWGISVMADTYTGRFDSVQAYSKIVNESCTLVQEATSEVSKKVAK